MTTFFEHVNERTRRRTLLFILVLAGLTGLTACSRKNEHRQLYELKGKVVSVDRTKREVVIDHAEVPGLMGAMVMPFTLNDDDALKILASGDQIQATLVVTDSGAWLENPVVTKIAPGSGTPPEGGTSAEPQAGAEVPNFSLVNQDGKPVRMQNYKGRALLVTFIYTRCPLPDYCPLMSANFAEINRELEKDSALGAKAHLLSITVDPAYDTPKVLRSYGAAHTEKYNEETFRHWELATGDPEEIKRTAQFFGLTYFAEKDQIVHSLRTALVAPDGRLFKIYRGNEWKPADVLRDLKSLVS
jgi:protein SCO1/2